MSAIFIHSHKERLVDKNVAGTERASQNTFILSPSGKQLCNADEKAGHSDTMRIIFWN